MPQRDVAQLILEVDARIATAQRSVNQLAKAVTQDAATMDTALGKVAQSHARLGKTLNDNGRVRAGFTQLSFQIGDVTQQMSLGVNASRIFAQQSGQVIQALQVMGGEGNKFLQFLGGPWGIAISTGAVILGSLIPPLLASRDKVGELVDKMREQAQQARDNKAANEIWKRSIDGVTEAIQKQKDELDKEEETPRSKLQTSLEDAKKGAADAANLLKQARERKAQLQKEIDQQKKIVDSAQFSPASGQDAAIEVENAQQRLGQLQARLSNLDKIIAGQTKAWLDAQSSIRGYEADLSKLDVEGKLDPVKKATDDLAQTEARLHAQRRAGIISLKSYNDQLEAAKKHLEDVQKAAKEAGSATGEVTNFSLPVQGTITGHFGDKRPGHTHAGVDIAVPVGTAVKAPAAGTVIEAGSLPGYGNVVFIDHGGGTITRLAHLSKISVTKGQQLDAGAVIGLSGGAKGTPGSGDSTGPHVHYEVRRGGKAVNPLTGKFATDAAGAAVRGQNAAESAADKAVRQQNAFEEELDRLNQELIRAKGDLIQGTDNQAKFAEQQVFAEERAFNAAKDHDVEEGKISQANADTLKAKKHEITVEKLKSIETERQIKLIREQSEAEQRRFQYQIDDLRFADEMARTAAERRQIELAILDALYAQKKAELEAAKAAAEKAGNTKDAADAQAALDRLPTEKAHDQARTLRGTMSPLEAWADQVPKTAAEINEALQSIEARGLDSLTSALTDVITGTKSLGDAFNDVAKSIIADIIQMTIRMLIFRAISSIFGLGSGPSGSIAPLTFAAKGLAFDGGNVVPFASGGIVSSPTLFGMGGGRTGVMGEAGPEAIMPLGRDAMGRLGVRAANAGRGGAGGGPIEITIGFGDAPEFAPYVQAVAGASAGRAVKLSVDHTNRTLARLGRPKLMG